ncbi:MAG: metallophosphoesterase family protein, partial [Planctomycetota bacterium]
VFPEDIYNPRKMERLFGFVKSTCFLGHTHLPGVFTEQGAFLSPPELDFQYHLGSGKTIVNIGSVGQPRDGDPRACYVVLEKRTISFRRIDYDVGETVRKVRDLR